MGQTLELSGSNLDALLVQNTREVLPVVGLRGLLGMALARLVRTDHRTSLRRDRLDGRMAPNVGWSAFGPTPIIEHGQATIVVEDRHKQSRE